MGINPHPPLSNQNAENLKNVASTHGDFAKKILKVAGISQTIKSEESLVKIKKLINNIEEKVRSGDSRNLKKDLSQVKRQVVSLCENEHGHKLSTDKKEKINKILFNVGMGIISEHSPLPDQEPGESVKAQKKLKHSKVEVERMKAKPNANAHMTSSTHLDHLKAKNSSQPEHSLDFLKNYGFDSVKIEKMYHPIQSATLEFFDQMANLVNRIEELETKFNSINPNDKARLKLELINEIEVLEMQKNTLNESIEGFAKQVILNHLPIDYPEEKREEVISKLNNFIIDSLSQ